MASSRAVRSRLPHLRSHLPKALRKGIFKEHHIMATERQPDGPEQSSRRRFLRGGVQGTALFGLGGLLGALSARAGAGEMRLVAASSPQGSLGKEYDYDLSAYRKTDPKLLQYEESARITAGFKEVRGVAIGSEDRVFVAGDQAIRCFNRAGERLNEIALQAPPRCVALAADGTLLIGFKNFVAVYGSDGKLQQKWAELGKDAVITCLAATDKDVFVADAGNRIVLRFDRSGHLIKQIGKKDPAKNVPGFIVPSPYFDLAVGPDGLLWVANTGRHHLEAYTFDGDYETGWGESSVGLKGFCGCCNPAHFAILPDGRFVTSEKGLARVKVYSPKGEFDGVVAGPESFPKHLDNPTGAQAGIDVAADSQGRVILADSLSAEVRIFSRLKKLSV